SFRHHAPERAQVKAAGDFMKTLHRPRAAKWGPRVLAGLGLPSLLLSSCAYYNTYYLARKYYFKGTEGLPYTIEKPLTPHTQEFSKTIDYAKKLISQYPKDGLVDDAYLLWAR